MNEPSMIQDACAQDLSLRYRSVEVGMEDSEVAKITCYGGDNRARYVMRVRRDGSVIDRFYPQAGRTSGRTGAVIA